MAIKRRTFLQALAIAGTYPLLPKVFAAQNQELIIGASRLDENHFAVSAVNLTGQLLWQFELPSRGHDVALHTEKNIGVAVARRPGQFLVMFDTQTGEVWQRIHMPDDLALNGHAIWVENQLVVAASDRATSAMRLLHYELQGRELRLTDIFPFDVIEPHQLVLSGDDIFVAVGGLKTEDRTVLNKDGFESFLLQIDAHSFTVKNRYSSNTQQVSLRHLCLDHHGQIVIAGQAQNAPSESETLLFVLRHNQLQPFEAPTQLWQQVQGYLGSVQSIGQQIVVTSPRSHWMGRFNATTLVLEDQLFAHDICALAISTQGLVAGTGTGKLIIGEQQYSSGVIWDNHFQTTG